MALDAGTALKQPVLSAHSDEDYYFTLRAIIASPKLKHRLRAGAKAFCVPIVVLLVIAALGPAKWAPRTHLGWQFDHFIGYFGITLFVCFAWPRPFVVGGVFAAIAALLEVLQAFTPDRSAYLPAIIYGAAGALVAALIAELVVRVWRWFNFARRVFETESMTFVKNEIKTASPTIPIPKPGWPTCWPASTIQHPQS